MRTDGTTRGAMRISDGIGITYHVELEVRDGTTAVPKLVPEGARRPVELSERDVQFLRARCPWKVQ